MKTKTLLTAMALSCLLSACGGGGNKGPDLSKEAALSACEPSSGPVGTKVVCSVKDMTEDATLFFDGKPVEYILNIEDGAVSFTVPASLPGDKKVYSQEGDSGVNPIGTFQISGNVASDGDVTPPPAPAPAGEDGDVINPSGSGTGGTTTGEDAGATGGGTTGGATGGTTGGTPPPPAALAATLKVDKQFDTRLGLVKLHWSVTGGDEVSELYIYGAFYRIEADGTATSPCGKIEDAYGKRNLLVHSDGNDLHDGSPNFLTWNNYMSSAQKCTSGTNCHGYTAPTVLNDPDGGTYETRNLTAKLDDFTFNPGYKIEQVPEKNLNFDNIGEIMFADNPPYCRMDLKNAGAFVKSGDLYTRLLTRTPFTLYVKTATDEKKVTTAADKLPPANITATVEVLTNEPKIKFTANYGYALLPMNPPAGCTKTASNYNPKATGSTSSISADCPLTKTQEITVSAVGIGLAGSASETFKIESNVVQKELKPTVQYETDSTVSQCSAGSGDWWRSCPKKGELQLFGYATRTWTISQKNGSKWDTVGSPKQAPWIKGMEIKGYKYDGSACGTSNFKAITSLDSLPSGVSVDVDGRLLLKAKLPRNHGCTRYELETQDLDTTWNAKESIEAPYVAEFDVVDIAGGSHYSCMIDDCDAWGDGACCDAGDCGACGSDTVSDCTGHTTTSSFNWHGRNLKSVTSTCGGDFNAQPDGNSYDIQTGNWSNSVSGTSMICEIKATTWDGQVLTRSFGIGPWTDNC